MFKNPGKSVKNLGKILFWIIWVGAVIGGIIGAVTLNEYGGDSSAGVIFLTILASVIGGFVVAYLMSIAMIAFGQMAEDIHYLRTNTEEHEANLSNLRGQAPAGAASGNFARNGAAPMPVGPAPMPMNGVPAPMNGGPADGAHGPMPDGGPAPMPMNNQPSGQAPVGQAPAGFAPAQDVEFKEVVQENPTEAVPAEEASVANPEAAPAEEVPAPEAAAAQSSGRFWFCPQCGTKNGEFVTQCRCGLKRTWSLD